MTKQITVMFDTADEAHAEALLKVIQDVAPHMVDNVQTTMSEDNAPDNEHVFLVAFHMSAPTMRDAQLGLIEMLPGVGTKLNYEGSDVTLEEYWVAEDERYEGSDNDSAVFVPGTGHQAWLDFHERKDAEKASRPGVLRRDIDGLGRPTPPTVRFPRIGIL